MKAPTPQSSIGKIVLAIWPWLILSGFHRYTVGKVNADGTIDLNPPAGLLAPPPLPRVAQWTLGGAQVTPAVGSELAVVYLDNDASRPAIVSFAPLAATKPTALELDSAAGSTIAIGATSQTINVGGIGALAAAVAPLVAAELTKIGTSIGQVAALLNAPGPVIGAPASVALYTPSTVAATKVLVK